MTIGDRVRTLLEILADDGTLIPIGSPGTVIGHESERLIVEFDDPETGTTRTATANPWELFRPVRRTA